LIDTDSAAIRNIKAGEEVRDIDGFPSMSGEIKELDYTGILVF